MTSFSITRYSGIQQGWSQVAEKRTQREALLLWAQKAPKSPHIPRQCTILMDCHARGREFKSRHSRHNFQKTTV